MKTKSIEFGPIKTKEMKSLEKINEVLNQNYNSVETRILIKVIIITSDSESIILSYQELADLCKLPSKQMLSLKLSSLCEKGLVVKKIAPKKYEFSYDVSKLSK